MATITFDDRSMDAKLDLTFINTGDHPDKRLVLQFKREGNGHSTLDVAMSAEDVARMLRDLAYSQLTKDLFAETRRQLDVLGRTDSELHRA